MARLWAMMLPANAENCAQLVPNWNSSGMPVTTPMMKLTPNSRLQNRTARFAASSRRSTAIVLRITRSRARPIVNGGKR